MTIEMVKVLLVVCVRVHTAKFTAFREKKTNFLFHLSNCSYCIF